MPAHVQTVGLDSLIRCPDIARNVLGLLCTRDVLACEQVCRDLFDLRALCETVSMNLLDSCQLAWINNNIDRILSLSVSDGCKEDGMLDANHVKQVPTAQKRTVPERACECVGT